MVLLNSLHSSAVGQQSSPGKHLQSVTGVVSSHWELTVAANASKATADFIRSMIDQKRKGK
jgi:hypothetical protein